MALLPGAFVRGALRPLVGAVTLGSVLPDVLGRVVPLALEQAQLRGLPVPVLLVLPWNALHSPAGSLAAAGVVAFLFVPEHRSRVFAAVALGIGLHLGLDVLQFHHGQGYPLLLPFSWATFELGWIGSEATVPWALPLLALTGLAWGARAWQDRPREQGVNTRQG